MVFTLYVASVLVLLHCKTTLQTLHSVITLDAYELLAGAGHKPLHVFDRHGATDRKVLLLRKGQTAYLDMCVNSETQLQILDIKYSSHGDPCAFSVSVQKETILEFQTDNITRSRHPYKHVSVAKPMFTKRMRPGRFRMEFKVQEAGSKGLNIDFIKLAIDNKQSKGELLCKVHCMNTINYRRTLQRFSWRPKTVNKPYILQKSYTTKCAEEDNINIPIFIDNLKSLRVTATFPKYHSFVNKRDPDFENCAMVSALWTFEEIIFESNDTPGKMYHKASIGPKHTKHVHGDVAALITGINARKMTINVQFKLEGQAIGVVDADIGSRLFIKLRGIAKNTDVSIKYRGRHARWFKGDIKTFSDTVTEHTWDIPDFTWSESDYNYIYVEIHYPWYRLRNFEEIEKIELDRRYKKPTRFFHMYNDGKYLMEGANIDFWWLINQTMTVRIIETGELFPVVDYFRIYSKIPWSKDLFSQIFVIYQDGNVRLLPVSPHGIDWIPFGSSILIGQSDVNSPRPSAPIKHIDVSIQDLVLHVYYRDGGYILMQIQPKFLSTIVKIQTAKIAESSKDTALLTFRSMWVANGNADVDHVSVDGTARHILTDEWNTLKGSYFAFFRQCISKHNSLSPDIIVEIDDNI